MMGDLLLVISKYFPILSWQFGNHVSLDHNRAAENWKMIDYNDSCDPQVL